MKLFKILLAGTLLLSAVACTNGNKNSLTEKEMEEEEYFPLGFNPASFSMEESKVRNGETFSGILNRLGLSNQEAYALTNACKEDFDVRKVIAGKKIEAYYSKDSLNRRLEYLVYEQNRICSAVFKCRDSLSTWTYEKPIEKERRISDFTIRTSLWVDMLEAGASPLLIAELSDIYAWTVDFFGLQEGDRFRVIYNQNKVDDEVVEIESVDFAIYSRGNYNAYAIRLDQGDGGNKYWNEKGESMRKAFLKAPLRFNRVSSKFSYHRKHPVTGKVKAHTGVDYAAPAGTPVHALGDGTVVSAGWNGGGGNTIKIRHNSVYSTGYLHLRGFAKGIRAGARVSQGQTIGYVGSTGTSTGPHLDFRVWKNGSPINPLKMESPSTEPLKKEFKPRLDSLFNHYIVELD